jgi:hypothetical protein
MGGASSSRLGYSEAARALVFSGTVTTAFNGGFASVRSLPWPGWAALGGGQGVRMVVRGDGRTYKLNLKASAVVGWWGNEWAELASVARSSRRAACKRGRLA